MEEAPPAETPPAKPEKKARKHKKHKKSGRFLEGHRGGGTTSRAAQFRTWVENFRQHEVTTRVVEDYWRTIIRRALYDEKLTSDEQFKWMKELGDRLLGRARVEGELTVTSNISVDQRVLVAKMLTGLVPKALPTSEDQPIEITTFAPKQIDSISSVSSERAVPDIHLGDLLHPEQPERESILGQFEPSSEAADPPPLRVEREPAQESDSSESVEQVRQEVVRILDA